MRLIRRHRLDDPRITDELRAVLVRAAVERLKTASKARHRVLNDRQRFMLRVWEANIDYLPQALESVPKPAQAPRSIYPIQDKPIAIDAIQKRISAHFHLRELGDHDLKARSNRQIITFPRQLAMYLARQLTMASLPEIGRQFGGMHHTTVLHAINRIERILRRDQDLDRTITRLVETLALR